MKKPQSWILGLATICFTETFTHGLVFSTFVTLLLQDSYFFATVQESFRYLVFGCVLATTPLIRLVITPLVEQLTRSLPRKILLSLCASLGAIVYTSLLVS